MPVAFSVKGTNPPPEMETWRVFLQKFPTSAYWYPQETGPKLPGATVHFVDVPEDTYLFNGDGWVNGDYISVASILNFIPIDGAEYEIDLTTGALRQVGPPPTETRMNFKVRVTNFPPGIEWLTIYQSSTEHKPDELIMPLVRQGQEVSFSVRTPVYNLEFEQHPAQNGPYSWFAIPSPYWPYPWTPEEGATYEANISQEIFRKLVVPPPLPAPTLVAPANNSITEDDTPEFRWNPVSGADSYDIEVARDSQFTNLVMSHTVPSTSHIHPEPLPNAVYYWRVGANKGTEGGPWSQTWSFEVRVFVPLPTLFLSVSPTVIYQGEEGVLSWQTTNATRVTIEPLGVMASLSGSVRISPNQTITYHGIAEGPGGRKDAWVALIVLPQVEKPFIGLTISPSKIRQGERATLTWESENATRVTIEPGLGEVTLDGSRGVSPTENTTYRAMAEGPGGSAEDSVLLVVTRAGPAWKVPLIVGGVFAGAVALSKLGRK